MSRLPVLTWYMEVPGKFSPSKMNPKRNLNSHYDALEQPVTKENLVQMLRENFQKVISTLSVAHKMLENVAVKLKRVKPVFAVTFEDLCDDATLIQHYYLLKNGEGDADMQSESGGSLENAHAIIAAEDMPLVASSS